MRLVPRNTFLDNKYTDKEIANNSFKNLKEINVVASVKPQMAPIKLDSLDIKEFQRKN